MKTIELKNAIDLKKQPISEVESGYRYVFKRTKQLPIEVIAIYYSKDKEWTITGLGYYYPHQNLRIDITRKTTSSASEAISRLRKSPYHNNRKIR